MFDVIYKTTAVKGAKSFPAVSAADVVGGVLVGAEVCNPKFPCSFWDWEE